jgi:curved DNA-binding protein CbpA
VSKRSSTSSNEKKWNYYSNSDIVNITNYDCYSILGVTFNADVDEIKRAYRRLALQYHPDRNKNPEATMIFKVIQMAYDTLTDKGLKRKYDSTIPTLGAMSEANRVHVVLEGAFSEGYVMDDMAAISLTGSDEAIVFENSISIPIVWIHSGGQAKQYSLFSDKAFERLFEALYKIIEPKTRLESLETAGRPELRAHFDARFWNRGQTNVSLYCSSSMSFTIINGLPFLYLTASSYEHTHAQISPEIYGKMKEAISNIIFAELQGTVEPPKHVLEPEAIFTPAQKTNELKLPPRETCSAFATIARTKSAQAAVDMLAKTYGIPSMKMVFQHVFPIKDMVCKDALAVYYSNDMIAYFRPAGTTMSTILHEFYHHLVNCYGIHDVLDYAVLPDPVTGYYARNDREEHAANSYSQTFLRRAIS